MFDVVTYALLKKTAALGIGKIEYANGKLIFTMSDGSAIEVPVDLAQSAVKTIYLDENQSLVVEFHDAPNLVFSPATKQELAATQEKIQSLETNYSELNEAQTILKQELADLGLSVVGGKLHVTYVKENDKS